MNPVVCLKTAVPARAHVRMWPTGPAPLPSGHRPAGHSAWGLTWLHTLDLLVCDGRELRGRAIAVPLPKRDGPCTGSGLIVDEC